MAVQTITVSSDMAAALKLLQAIPIAKLTEVASSASAASCSDPGPPGSEAEMLAFATQEARAVIQKVLTADTHRINALAALEGEAASSTGPKPYSSYVGDMKVADAQLAATADLDRLTARLEELTILGQGILDEMMVPPGGTGHVTGTEAEQVLCPDGDIDYRRFRSFLLHVQATGEQFRALLDQRLPRLRKEAALSQARWQYGNDGSSLLSAKLAAQDNLIADGSLEEKEKKSPAAIFEQNRADMKKAALEDQKDAKFVGNLAEAYKQANGGGGGGGGGRRGQRGGRNGNDRKRDQSQMQQQLPPGQQQQQQQQQQQGGGGGGKGGKGGGGKRGKK